MNLHRFTRGLAAVALALVVGVSHASAQTALNTTTLSQAITSNTADVVSLASATNIAVGDLLVVDREAMRVLSLSPLRVARNAAGTRPTQHVSGALVHTGVPERFSFDTPASGACTRSAERFLPRVVLPLGDVWDCPAGAGVWALVNSAATMVAESTWFNLDNGAGTTIDDVIIRPARPIRITAARIVYVDAATGTVAGGNARLGTTLGGSEIAAATAYANTSAVGTVTGMTIANGSVAAGGAVFVRHTGVAVTQAGQAYVEIEYHFR